MTSYSQKEAALLSGFEERSFRTLVDHGVILPSPETRAYKRGKAKTFAKDEIVLASIMKKFDTFLEPLQKVQISDWLRRHLAESFEISTEEKPLYVLIETQFGGGWQASIRDLTGWGEGDKKYISVFMKNCVSGEERPANSLILVNIMASQRIFEDDEVLKEILDQHCKEESEKAE